MDKSTCVCTFDMSDPNDVRRLL
jgi:hypothetical protein